MTGRRRDRGRGPGECSPGATLTGRLVGGGLGTNISFHPKENTLGHHIKKKDASAINLNLSPESTLLLKWD